MASFINKTINYLINLSELLSELQLIFIGNKRIYEQRHNNNYVYYCLFVHEAAIQSLIKITIIYNLLINLRK